MLDKYHRQSSIDKDTRQINVENRPENIPLHLPVEYFSRDTKNTRFGILEYNNYPKEIRLVLMDEDSLEFYNETGTKKGLKISNPQGLFSVIDDPLLVIEKIEKNVVEKYGLSSKPAEYLNNFLEQLRAKYKSYPTGKLSKPNTDAICYEELNEQSIPKKIGMRETKRLKIKKRSGAHSITKKSEMTGHEAGSTAIVTNVPDEKERGDNMPKKKDLRNIFTGKTVFFYDEGHVLKGKITNYDIGNFGTSFDIEYTEKDKMVHKLVGMKDIYFEKFDLEKDIKGKNLILLPDENDNDNESEQINKLIDDIDWNNISADDLYSQFSKVTHTKSMEIMTARIENVLTSFRHSVLFSIEIDEQKAYAGDFRDKTKEMDWKNNEQQIKFALNQFIKLKWIENEGKNFTAKFENENWVDGGMRTKLIRLCHNFFNKNIGGECDAKKAIENWENNKKWLYNQAEIIWQANRIDAVQPPKQSLWQKGVSFVKGWFKK